MANDALIERLKAGIARIESGDSGQNAAMRTSNDARKTSLQISRRSLQNESRQSGENDSAGKTQHAESRIEDADAAFKKIISLVNARDRSIRQIESRLTECDYSTDAIDEAVARAVSCQILDDSRYAETLVRSRINQGKGSVGIERELRSEGIDINCVAGWPHEFDVSYDAEFARAFNLLEQKPTHAKNKMQAAYRKLAQAGYPSHLATDAARAWCEKHGYR